MSRPSYTSNIRFGASISQATLRFKSEWDEI